MTDRRDAPRHALVIRVPRKHEIQIEDAYLGLAGLTRPVMSYHITLLGPFRFRREPSDEAEETLALACHRWEPFDVRVHGLDAFEAPDNNVVYLDVVNSEQVMALRGFLLKQMLPLVLPENERVAQFTLANYHPHLTLGLGLSDGQLRDIRAREARGGVDVAFRVDCVWLAAQDGSSPWRYVRSFALGGDGPAPCDPGPH